MKIYDCFVFNDEYDVLKIRLETYYDYVDYFVLCECTKTQVGGAKPRNYFDHQNSFRQFSDKIIYVCADEPPKLEGYDDWSIEFYQRNAIKIGLRNAGKEDVVILSDVDEFYNPEILLAIRKNKTHPYKLHLANKEKGKKKFILQYLALFSQTPLLPFYKSRLGSFLKKSCFAIEQDFFNYFMNLRRSDRWYGTVVCLYKNISTMQDLRDRRNVMPYLSAKTVQTGWHFSYLGGKEKIKEKLRSIVEGSHIPIDESHLDEHIERCLEEGKDIFMRNDKPFEFLEEKDISFPNLKEIIARCPYLWHSKN